MEYKLWLKELDYELDRQELGAKREDFPGWDWKRMYRAGAAPQDVAGSVIQCKYKKGLDRRLNGKGENK